MGLVVKWLVKWITWRQCEVCVQPWCNHLWLTGLTARTNLGRVSRTWATVTDEAPRSCSRSPRPGSLLSRWTRHCLAPSIREMVGWDPLRLCKSTSRMRLCEVAGCICIAAMTTPTSSDEKVILTVLVWAGAVSYTHLTLPTNAEV